MCSEMDVERDGGGGGEETGRNAVRGVSYEQDLEQTQKHFDDDDHVHAANEDQSAAALSATGDDSEPLADDADDDEITAKRRKKTRGYLTPISAARKRKSSQTPGGRTMAEWKQTCQDLHLPVETKQFCDYVLVFDEIADDVAEVKSRTGCCSCCQKSSKQLQECVKVRRTDNLTSKRCAAISFRENVKKITVGARMSSE